MTGKLDVLTRGTDSSGRPLRGTRQMFELHDRCNAMLGGMLVPVQGSFNEGVSASAGTHDRAGCWDWRSWNLTTDQRNRKIRFDRDHGCGTYYRTAAEGFDPHFHGILLSDAPMHPATSSQRTSYISGRNALASNGPDTFPYRPVPLVLVYDYLGEVDDMFSERDSKRLQNVADRTVEIKQLLARFVPAEAQRDAAERKRLIERNTRLTTRLAGMADRLGEVERNLKGTDDTTKTVRDEVRKTRQDILSELREDPATDGTPDNPSDDGLAESH